MKEDNRLYCGKSIFMTI